MDRSPRGVEADLDRKREPVAGGQGAGDQQVFGGVIARVVGAQRRVESRQDREQRDSEGDRPVEVFCGLGHEWPRLPGLAVIGSRVGRSIR